MKVSSIAKILSFLAILFLATPLIQSRPVGCPSVVESDDTDSEKKEFIVMLKTDTLASKAASDHFDMLTNCLGRAVNKFDPFSSSSLQTDVNEVLDISVEDITAYVGHFSNNFATNVLNKLPEVDFVEESIEVTGDAIPIEKSKTQQKNLDRVDTAQKVFDGFYDYPSSGGEGVNIYIIDSGVRITHKDFGGRARYGGHFCPKCDTADDLFGHGTHVAGIAAGKTFGVAKLANIISVRVFDAKDIATTPTILKGLAYVLSAHKKDPTKKSIANMSFHTQERVSKAMIKYVLKLTENGIHAVVSAGNLNEPACNQSPAAAETAITVGATDQLTDKMAAFSNFGKCVDIYAPGVNVTSTYIYSDKDTRVLSGTSMATPHVAGTVALLISTSGNKSPADMANLVRSLATKNVIQGIPDNVNNYFLRVPHN